MDTLKMERLLRQRRLVATTSSFLVLLLGASLLVLTGCDGQNRREETTSGQPDVSGTANPLDSMKQSDQSPPKHHQMMKNPFAAPEVDLSSPLNTFETVRKYIEEYSLMDGDQYTAATEYLVSLRFSLIEKKRYSFQTMAGMIESAVAQGAAKRLSQGKIDVKYVEKINTEFINSRFTADEFGFLLQPLIPNWELRLSGNEEDKFGQIYLALSSAVEEGNGVSFESEELDPLDPELSTLLIYQGAIDSSALSALVVYISRGGTIPTDMATFEPLLISKIPDLFENNIALPFLSGTGSVTYLFSRLIVDLFKQS